MNEEATHLQTDLSGSRTAVLGAGLLLIAGVAYWASERLLPTWWSDRPDLYVYVGRPLLWLAVGALALALFRRLPGRPRFDSRLTLIAAFAALFHISVLVIAGVAQGFGQSAVAGRLAAYPGNIFRLAAALVGLEAVRSAVVWSWRVVGRWPALGITAIVCFVLSVPMAQFGGLADSGRLLLVGGLLLVPAFGLSLVATWLAARGGIWPAFAYVMIVRGFAEFSPSVPDLSWTWSALLGLAVPITTIALIRHIHEYIDSSAGASDDHFREVRIPGWVSLGSTGLALLAMILFGTGVFGVKPFVVSGSSMLPTYRAGDVVVIESVDPSLLTVGDVVRFDLHELSIMHRIVEIESMDGALMVTTQGDRNSRADPPLPPDEVDGRVLFAIPGPQTIVAWLRGEL